MEFSFDVESHSQFHLLKIALVILEGEKEWQRFLMTLPEAEKLRDRLTAAIEAAKEDSNAS